MNLSDYGKIEKYQRPEKSYLSPIEERQQIDLECSKAVAKVVHEPEADPSPAAGRRVSPRLTEKVLAAEHELIEKEREIVGAFTRAAPQDLEGETIRFTRFDGLEFLLVFENDSYIKVGPYLGNNSFSEEQMMLTDRRITIKELEEFDLIGFELACELTCLREDLRRAKDAQKSATEKYFSDYTTADYIEAVSEFFV